ncbi:MAG: glycosyltransferase family 4 protein [Gemmatimonadota bacterium]
MTRSRILHLIDTGGPGGAETIFLELVRGLPALGWDSVPIVPEDDWLAGALRAEGFAPPTLAASGRFTARYARALRALVRTERIDLVQTHLLGTSVYATLACLGTSVPVVSTFHGIPDISVTDRLRLLKLRLLQGASNRVVCVSDSLAHHVASLGYGAPIKVIPNGIDVRAFSAGGNGRLRGEIGIGADETVVGAVGNVRPSKAYDVLLDAFARVRAAVPEARLVVAGQARGALHQQLLEQRARLGLDGAADFIGFRSDVADVLGTFDVFVLSSSDEGFSLSTVQAMAAGLPVVATRCGGPELIVGDSGGALLVPPNDPGALAGAIIQVIRSPSLAAGLRAAGRQRAFAAFSLERMLGDYDALYGRCLEQR